MELRINFFRKKIMEDEETLHSCGFLSEEEIDSILLIYWAGFDEIWFVSFSGKIRRPKREEIINDQIPRGVAKVIRVPHKKSETEVFFYDPLGR